VHVRTIVIIGRSKSPYDSRTRLAGSELRVGNSTDPTANPSCDVVVDAGGFYDCDLWGQYVFLRHTGGNNLYLNIGEISIWSQKNISPNGVASQSSESSVSRGATNAQIPVPIHTVTEIVDKLSET